MHIDEPTRAVWLECARLSRRHKLLRIAPPRYQRSLNARGELFRSAGKAVALAMSPAPAVWAGVGEVMVRSQFLQHTQLQLCK